MDEPSLTPEPPQIAHPALRSEASRTLFAVLDEKDREDAASIYKLSPIYLGAKVTIRHTNNPDYLAQAAHSIRELIDRLPKRFDVPTFEYQDLRSRARVLVDTWKAIPGGNPKATEAARAKFEKVMNRFATELDAVTITRRVEAGKLISSMDASGRTMPPVIANLRVAEWGAYRGYFVVACHHGETTQEEFDQMLEQFELFLLDRLRPRAVADQAALKAIVAEGEPRG